MGRSQKAEEIAQIGTFVGDAVLFPAKRFHAIEVADHIAHRDVFDFGIAQVQTKYAQLEAVTHHGIGCHSECFPGNKLLNGFAEFHTE